VTVAHIDVDIDTTEVSVGTDLVEFDIGVPGGTGPQGPAGATGPTGPQGPAGVDGVDGADSTVPGPVGETGPTGAQGPPGPTGPQGPLGNTGPQGPEGAQGAAGPVGPAGLNWRGSWSSATDYAPDDAVGYAGSSWFASGNPPVGEIPSGPSPYWQLLASQGATGPQGPQGIQGIPGVAGIQGPVGATGPQGPTGATGADSTVPGPAGPQGVPGPPGSTNAIYTATWNWTTKTADANTAKQIGVNAATWAATTQVNVNQQKADNADTTMYLAGVKVGDTLRLQHKTDATRYGSYTVTGAGVDQGAWWSFPVSFVDGAGAVPGGTTDTALSILIEGPTGLRVRSTATWTTASLANNAVGSGTVTIAAGYRMLQVSTDKAARVRLYTSTGKRDADVARPVGTDPSGDHGLMLEYVTTASVLAADLSPQVDAFTHDGGASVPYAVTNLSGTTGTIMTILNYVRTE
jgi:Collagen triple helix repeat (20 copies)